VAQGFVTCDSFGGLRWLIVPSWRRMGAGVAAGRWSVVRRERDASPPSAEFVARQLLRRTGVVFRKTLAREKQPLLWRDVARACRTLEARGEVRGGRFVGGFDGEQYALPEAVTLLRDVRKRAAREAGPVAVTASDPLNFRGILTPEERVSPMTRRLVQVG
jgi:ATP-dependent Lhr-like helicase